MMDLDALESTLSRDEGRTHWEKCYLQPDHKECAIESLLRLARVGQELAEACEMARNAFEKNWAIDWGMLDKALAAWDKAAGG